MDASATLDAPARDLVDTLHGEATRTGTPGPNALARSLYADLRRIARAHRAGWHGNATLNTTALVHEAYLRLSASGAYKSGDHFLNVASRAMRQVLINYARQRSAAKRGGGLPDVALDDAPALVSADQASAWLELDSALDRLAAMDARGARVVELKVFAGFEVAEVAEALGVSEATIARDWRRVRAWLRGELGGDLPRAPDP
ncbi:MAG: ECF-type sigma factor [Bacteroidota bacterium]